jgi:hypothetical protein
MFASSEYRLPNQSWQPLLLNPNADGDRATTKENQSLLIARALATHHASGDSLPFESMRKNLQALD